MPETPWHSTRYIYAGALLALCREDREMTDSLTQLLYGLWGNSTPTASHPAAPQPTGTAAPQPAGTAAPQPAGTAAPGGSHPFGGIIEGGVGSAALGQLFNGLMGRAPSAGAQGAAVVGLLGYLMGGRGGASGVALLTDRLRQAGLGAQVDSWIAHTGNAPVAPEDLARVFPEQALDSVERHTGLGRAAVLKQISQGLPQMVDRLTPRGQVPTTDQEMSNDHPDHLLEGFGLAGQQK